MTIITLMAALALQTLPAPGLPGSWQLVGTDAQGDLHVWPESVTRSGNEVSAIVRIEVNRGERTGRRILGVIRYAFDCAANTVRMEAGDLYEGNGDYIGVAPLAPEHRANRPVPARSPSAVVRDHLCTGQRR